MAAQQTAPLVLQTTDQNNDASKPTKFKYPDKEAQRWASLNNILSRASSKFAPDAFDPDDDNLKILQESFRVLVVGAGGLGCEILKNLALSGFKDIEVIDLDIIDLSNLNRQFLFRMDDIGKSKAKVAAEFVMKRVPGCSIKWHNKKLQSFDQTFYTQFNVVVAGLDNIEARRWLNATLCDIVIESTDNDGNIDPATIIPFIDGGTEGFKGQCRLFVPMMSSCFECSIETMVPPKVFMDCTIATIPRRPEHCITFAKKKLFPRLKWLKTATNYEMVPLPPPNVKDVDPNGVKLDTDSIEHMSWIYNRSLERGKEFGIEGVTYNLTMQVVKNIIPAIASTNALISAICVNEAFKVLTWSSFGLNNYFMYIGQEGIHSRSFEYKKKATCPICGTLPVVREINPNIKFKIFYEMLKTDKDFQLKSPSVYNDTNNNDAIYIGNKALCDGFKDNLEKKMFELIKDKDILRILDKKTLNKRHRKVKIVFKPNIVTAVAQTSNDKNAQ